MRITLTLILMCCLAGVYGQSSFGLEAGLNHARNFYQNESGRLGFHAGVYKDLPATGKLSLRTGLHYSLKGTRVDAFFLPQGGSMFLELHYLSVPLTGMYKFSDKLSMSFGPVASYLLASRISQGGVVLSPRPGDDDGFANWDIGMQVGLHLKLKGGTGVYARYEHGLVRTNQLYFTNGEGQLIFGSSNAHNRVFQVGLSRVIK